VKKSAAFALLALSLLPGCEEASAVEDAAASTRFEPPYRVDEQDPSRLIVRRDLAKRLVTAPAESSSVASDLIGFGHLEFAPGAAYSVKAPFDGFVEKVHVDVDDLADVGTLLATLRSPELATIRADLSKLAVKIRAESLNVKRLEPLVVDGTVAERELVEARARLDAARSEEAGLRAALKAAGVNGGKSDVLHLRSTLRGKVLSRNISPGERVSAESGPLFTIGDPDQLVVRASFPERDSLLLREGARCSFAVHSLSGRVHQGTITRIVRSVDPKTRATEAICETDGPVERLSAQMVARVTVEVVSEERTIIPRSALLLRRDDPVVFLELEPGVVERRVVRPGMQIGDRVQILEGIARGDRVVVEGAVLLDGELDVLL